MRIAQIAPLHERVPPRLYGGTERVVSYLTEELVRQGHDVTLFASGDSKTTAKLVRCCDMALRLNPSVKDALPYHVIMLDEVRQRSDEFDALHFHIDFLQAPLLHDIADRSVKPSTADWICRISRCSIGFFASCLWLPSRMISAGIYRTLIGPARSIMAFPAILFPFNRARRTVAISRFSAGSHRRKDRTVPLRLSRALVCG
jgi:glycosyltransferase involved in cell wall biosynthesis